MADILNTRTRTCTEILADFNLAVRLVNRQSGKLNSPPISGYTVVPGQLQELKITLGFMHNSVHVQFCVDILTMIKFFYNKYKGLGTTEKEKKQEETQT